MHFCDITNTRNRLCALCYLVLWGKARCLAQLETQMKRHGNTVWIHSVIEIVLFCPFLIQTFTFIDHQLCLFSVGHLGACLSVHSSRSPKGASDTEVNEFVSPSLQHTEGSVCGQQCAGVGKRSWVCLCGLSTLLTSSSGALLQFKLRVFSACLDSHSAMTWFHVLRHNASFSYPYEFEFLLWKGIIYPKIKIIPLITFSSVEQ